MKHALEKLAVIFDPPFWLRESIDHQWSDALDFLLDAVERGDAEIERMSEHVSRIGNVLIWTDNFPYSFGHRYLNGSSGLPRRRVAIRLNQALAVADVRAGLKRTRGVDHHVH